MRSIAFSLERWKTIVLDLCVSDRALCLRIARLLLDTRRGDAASLALPEPLYEAVMASHRRIDRAMRERQRTGTATPAPSGASR